ncbi:hypothetical protein [Rhodococcus artemisiae]|uniref:Uncharacterized protein n=1 Tax=Rhodococcus artemisiae TaxID=714159 RepID=A0ABU7L391_9NOCA|nr:hypothetical protein [Rhodococcus artemisiae]MEE2056018.1 hypothetical protein [Rhodococcus artemisiae]
MKVLQKLIRVRESSRESPAPHAGLPTFTRDHVSRWSPIEAILTPAHLLKFTRVDKAMKSLEIEAEAVCFELG